MNSTKINSNHKKSNRTGSFLMYEAELVRDEDNGSVIEMLEEAYEVDSLEGSGILYNNHPTYSRSLAIRDGNKIAASLSIFTSDNIIRGIRLPYAGIGSVATAPKYRNKGMCRALFKAAFKDMHEKGEVISALHPFLEQFYEKFGYARAEEFYRHSFEVENLRNTTISNDFTARKLMDMDKAGDVLNIIKSMGRFGSRVFPSLKTIERAIKQGNVFLFERMNEAVGVILLYVTSFDPKYGPEPFEIGQKGLHSGYSTAFTTEEVFPAMIKLLRDLCIEKKGTRIVLLGQREFPVRNFVINRNETSTKINPGFMVRIIDFVKFCRLIKIPVEARNRVVIQIKDDMCPWNEGVYSIQPSEGKLTVEETETETSPEVVMDAISLSRVISGLNTATILRALGLLQCTQETAQKLDAIFSQETLFVFDRV
ncbi:MAG: enhanced intracellular survival protein Eis [Candidatus Odinarchaeota archaeon]